ncbi:MAG: hypothetical protein ABIO51_05275 [Solirubrobacteraceae bacterium]
MTTHLTTTNPNPAEPCVIVIFGASGDLTSRKLIPALYEQDRQGRLAMGTSIVGVARTEMSDNQFRDKMLAGAKEHAASFDQSEWDRFARRLTYHAADAAASGSMDGLSQKIALLGAAAGILFGVSDVAIKAMTGMLGDGVLAIVSPWLAICILASVAAFYASARGLQDGDAVPVIAVTGAAANITGIAGGIIVFGDPLPGHTLGIVLQSVAFVMVIVASALTPAPVRAAGLAPAAA